MRQDRSRFWDHHGEQDTADSCLLRAVPSTLAHCGHRVHTAVSCFSITILQYNDLLDMSLIHSVSSTIQKKKLITVTGNE